MFFSGGILGAAFVAINHKITVYRNKYMKKKIPKVLEALIVAAISATIAFMMMYLVNDCKPLGEDPHVHLQVRPVTQVCAVRMQCCAVIGLGKHPWSRLAARWSFVLSVMRVFFLIGRHFS